MRSAQIAIAILLVVTVAGCSDRTGDGFRGASATPSHAPGGPLRTIIPADALGRSQAAIDGAGTYRITVTATNFVLPGWGGSDDGTVEVDSGANRARGVLNRTGEGGPYTIIWAGAQTVFQRATCKDWARISGSGTNVLSPFILAKNGALQKLGSFTASFENSELIYRGILDEPLGQVTIAIDPSTYLPRRIEQRSAGAPAVTWTFSDWGKKLDIPVPKASYDRGPGGNPC